VKLSRKFVLGMTSAAMVIGSVSVANAGYRKVSAVNGSSYWTGASTNGSTWANWWDGVIVYPTDYYNNPQISTGSVTASYSRWTCVGHKGGNPVQDFATCP
jgi:exopolysaccharide biosynthesis protein